MATPDGQQIDSLFRGDLVVSSTSVLVKQNAGDAAYIVFDEWMFDADPIPPGPSGNLLLMLMGMGS